MESPVYPKDFWYVMAEAREVGEKPLARTILNQPLVCYRDREGKPVVLEEFSDPEHYPRVTEVVPYLRVARLDDIFEYGIETIIEAMQQHLNSRRKNADTPRIKRKRAGISIAISMHRLRTLPAPVRRDGA